MVKFVSAQGYSSPFSGAIERAASTLWGDTLTPALKREQLLKAQRENAGAQNMMDLFRDVGGAAAGRPRAAPSAPTPALNIGKPLPNGNANPLNGPTRFNAGVLDTANAIGMDPVDLGTIISYETAGTFDPTKAGPTTQWGQHRGLIQFGEPQAEQYGVDWSDPVGSQLGADGAVARYFMENGWEPGMGLMDAYSIVNAGAPGRYGASDAANGGAPGTVADKVNHQMGGHRANAEALFGSYLPPATPSGMDGAPATDGTYNPLNAPQFYGELAARAVEGGMDPGDAADLARLFMAGTFGAENQATTDAFVGAGGNYADTYNGFAADQNRMERDSVRDDSTSRRGQDLNFDLGREKISTESEDRRYNTDQDNATKLTLDDRSTIEVLRDGVPRTILKSEMLPTDEAIISDAERKGIAAGGIDMSRDEQLAYVGAEPKNPPQADSYVDSAGTVYRSYDGVNTTDGEPLPPDALKTSVVSADRASAGLDKINERNTEAQVLSGQKFKGTVSRAREVAIAAGPTAFGIIGRARSLGQDVQAAFEAAGQAFGGDIEAVVASTESDLRARADSGDTVAKTFFANEYDPNITRLEMYTRLLPYEAASAIADQTGRGLSDNDVKRFQQIVGDPLAFFGTQQAFLTTLDTIEQEVDARLAANRATLEGGRDAVPPPQQPAPAAGQPPQVSTDEEYDALPSGSEFIAPDGSRRRKP